MVTNKSSSPGEEMAAISPGSRSPAQELGTAIYRVNREVVFLEAKDILQPDSSRLLKIFRMLQIAESNQAEINVCEIARLLV